MQWPQARKIENLDGYARRIVVNTLLSEQRPSDTHRSPTDQRIDVDPVQREVAEAAIERGVMVIVRSHRGDLHLCLPKSSSVQVNRQLVAVCAVAPR